MKLYHGPRACPRTTAGHLLAAGLLAATAVQAAPTPGRYEGRLCVATTAGTPECGPARLELRRADLALVQVSDILYSLMLTGSQVDVVLKHGAMQIDGFTAGFEWKGSALHFVDTAKGVRYEVQFGNRRP